MNETPLCPLADVPVVVVRRGEQVWAYANRCPHFSVPLDFEPGDVPCYRAQVLMCAHHSALFRFEDGRCIEGPCAGANLDAVKIAVEGNAWVVLNP
ncbi:Rieske (2Fe-2S) protein [Paraburkholderia sp. CI3]|uniref:Rieske (2Fe-2S) protein n=1 Tax=Paraburkholderia sp. CI3 TaxID=2991060 RepID=UPI003D20FF92